MLLVQANQFEVLVSLENPVDVPEAREARHERAGDVGDWGQVPAVDTQGEDGDCEDAGELRPVGACGEG